MKRTLAGLLLVCWALPAMATFLHTPDGERIRKGDPSARVLFKLGQPLQKTIQASVIRVTKRELVCSGSELNSGLMCRAISTGPVINRHLYPMFFPPLAL